MKSVREIWTSTIMVIGMISCVEPFNFIALDFDREIVVEGRITDETKSHFVKLSYTRSLDESNEKDPISGATVWIMNSEGDRIDLEESEPGKYLTDNDVTGEAGLEYQLFFSMDEKQYESNAQKLIASPPIDSIYSEYYELVVDSDEDVRPGIQFFLDMHDQTNTSNYFKYEYEETYEVHAPFGSYYEYFQSPDTVLFNNENVYICYPTIKSQKIVLGSTATLNQNRLSGLALRYITDQTDLLRYAYSILAKQYSISSSAYEYYQEFLANNEETGSLFDKQLGSVYGNVHLTGSADQQTLGFFEVSGLSEYRESFLYNELDKRYSWPQDQYECYSDQIKQLGGYDSLDYYINKKGYVIHTATYFPGGVLKTQVVPKTCGDCRFRGTNAKPDFWIY